MRKKKWLCVGRKLGMVSVLAILFLGCSNGYEHHRLKNASSPYLRAQSDGPVDWYEWGDEALAKAKNENKPLLISIGYSSCHWCHVMNDETFMDTAVARIMNENFICIKVDREERPDIDNIYTNTVQVLTGSSGWPLNAFSLPNGTPFFAGTYYSKKSWINLITQVAKAYNEKHDLVLKQADALTKGIANQNFVLPDTGNTEAIVSSAFYKVLYDSVYRSVDLINGGLKGAPKFPTPALGEWMLQHYYTSHNTQSLKAVKTILNGMALGGIYDQVEGGFSRYATDTAWRVPHFEKMLYDNGQLLSLYAHAYQLTRDGYYKRIMDETFTFIERNLAAKSGGYYSSTNADSDEEEGKYYSWNEKAFLNAVGGDKLIAAYFNVTASGNWKPGENILYATQTPEELAALKKVDYELFASRLAAAKASLLSARNKRIRPAVDEKIITAWNCILIKGYADAYAATGMEDYLEKAESCAQFVEKNMLLKDGSLRRIYIHEKASIAGFLDDYAWMVSAFIKLYEVTFDSHWAEQAKLVTDYALVHFDNKSTPLLFYSTTQPLDSISRMIEIADDYIPSSNAIMARTLYTLGIIYDDTTYSNRSLKMLAAAKLRVTRMPRYHLQWCLFTGLQANKSFEVALMGRDALAKNNELQKHYLPTSIFMGSTKEASFPLLKNKLVEGKTLIYVCTGKACKRPEEDAANAILQMK